MPAPDAVLVALRASAPSALWVYERAPVELQLLAAQQGWRLLFSKETAAPFEPAFALLGHAGRKCAMLVVRGTTSVHDVVTDIRALPVPFPPPANGEDMDDMDSEYVAAGLSGAATDAFGAGSVYENDHDGGWMNVSRTFALGGIARAAVWMHDEISLILATLAEAGYSIKVRCIATRRFCAPHPRHACRSHSCPGIPLVVV